MDWMRSAESAGGSAVARRRSKVSERARTSRSRSSIYAWPVDPLGVDNVRIKSLGELDYGERAAQPGMQAAAERQHLQGNVRPLAGFVEVLKLLAHDV